MGVARLYPEADRCEKTLCRKERWATRKRDPSPKAEPEQNDGVFEFRFSYLGPRWR